MPFTITVAGKITDAANWAGLFIFRDIDAHSLPNALQQLASWPASTYLGQSLISHQAGCDHWPAPCLHVPAHAQGSQLQPYHRWRPDVAWKWRKWTFGFWTDPSNWTRFGIDAGPLEIVWRQPGYRQ